MLTSTEFKPRGIKIRNHNSILFDVCASDRNVGPGNSERLLYCAQTLQFQMELNLAIPLRSRASWPRSQLDSLRNRVKQRRIQHRFHISPFTQHRRQVHRRHLDSSTFRRAPKHLVVGASPQSSAEIFETKIENKRSDIKGFQRAVAVTRFGRERGLRPLHGFAFFMHCRSASGRTHA
jgi:hypothetical protein